MNKTVNIYALYDKMTKELMPIFQMHNDETAIRNVVTAHIKGNIEFPDDIHLYRIGQLDVIEGNDSNLTNNYFDFGSISQLAERYKDERKQPL